MNPSIASPNIIPPTDSKDLLREGWNFYGSGKLDEAEASFRKVLSIDPDSIEATYYIGLVFKVQDRREEAIRAFTTVLTLLESDTSEDSIRKMMLRRLTKGHINRIKTGDWDLEKEIWKKK